MLTAQYPAGWPGMVLAAEARTELAVGDGVAIRSAKAGVVYPAEWRRRDADLREIIRTGAGVMPARPDYPAGT